MKACLKSVPLEQLIEATTKIVSRRRTWGSTTLRLQIAPQHNSLQFTALIDGDFLPAPLEELAAAAATRPRPSLVGVTEQESLW